ncbi:MAG TPA: VOC family protein [Kofleriaceae bacterium]|nr:VOC family protein [Kofleriaceae bacterium]
MTVTLSHCFIAVHDHDAALAFYRDALGLEVRMDVKYEGMRWVTVGPRDQPDVNIVLEPPLADPGASEADRKAMAELLAKGHLRGVNFATENCDATFEKLRASGAEVMQEPVDQAYGVRDCAFRDPSGNMIRFSQK